MHHTTDPLGSPLPPSITQGGKKWGRRDVTTARGMDPRLLVRSVCDSFEAGERDIGVNWDWKTRVGLWLRFLAPRVYDGIMEKRWRKEKTKEAGEGKQD